MAEVNDLSGIARSLMDAKTVAVVGCSPHPHRPSNAIARYLVSAGFDVIPVNPAADTILGLKAYPDLRSIPAERTIDVVDVFRRSVHVADVADQTLERGSVRLLFLQDGVVDAAAARRVADAGIQVAMDRCIFRDHSVLSRGGSLS